MSAGMTMLWSDRNLRSRRRTVSPSDCKSILRRAAGDKARRGVYEPAASVQRRTPIMAEILFIKTSSLGDVVHHMPAMTDARRHLPDARLTWVVEEAYAPLARLHGAVDEVIPVAARRWRASLRQPAAWRDILREIGRFRRAVRERPYDAIIDSQGLMRSALIARQARGRRHGYDMASIREPPASLFYDVRHRVEWGAHAIFRNRALCGVALGYAPKPPIDFGLDRRKIARPGPAENYAVLLHATARPTKEWVEAHWVAVARGVLDRGLDVVLPWGTETERARSEAIAAALDCGTGASQDRVRVLDRRPLDEVAAVIAGAAVVIGVDTGLIHVAAALGVPLVAIFVGSDPGLTGPMGAGPIAVLGGAPGKGSPPVPDSAETLRALDRLRAAP
jgi:heptosyltransferase-1